MVVLFRDMLYLIGLGLCDVKDITVKGLEKVRECKRVYLEAYTSILGVGKEELVRSLYWHPVFYSFIPSIQNSWKMSFQWLIPEIY